MSTVKITDLTEIAVNANTSNTILLGVDLPSDSTGKMTVQALSEGIYRNNPLNVGTSPITLPNTIGQFVSSSNNYIQVNLLNTDEEGTADYVVTANSGGDTYYYIDMGYTNINYNPLNANNSLGTSAYPLDGYLYVQGDGPGTLGGNLIIGTTTPDREVVLISGGVNFDNVSARITSTGIDLNFNKVLTFADDTVQSTAASPIAYSQAAFALANTANAYAYNANTFIQSNYLKNTSDTLTGNLVVTDGMTSKDSLVTGNLSVSGFFSLNNSSFSANTALVRLTASDGDNYVPPSNSYYMLHVTGKSNNVTRVVLDSFGANTYPLIAGRMGRGSAAVPAATANNDVMMRIVGNGYTGTEFPSSSPTKIDFVATENYSNTNRGSAIQFWNTPNGSNTIQKIAQFNADEVSFTGAVNPVNGFIYNPVIYPGAQTAITINFTNGPLLRAQTSTGLVATLSNFVAGKMVELWVTNTSGQNQTFIHGVSAINSTIGATSLAIPATTTICARYVCLDGTLANTMCAITKA